MIGVTKVGERYRVSIKNKHFGYFDTKLEAINVWTSSKIEEANNLAYDQADERVKLALVNYFKKEGMPNASE